ncbi:MAG TPA: class I SAM-dependent methyltransferase [Pyrinomonadaceae bacterium]|jgi:ubiquinone/menaquinone biosynthesis C-methylase UbiE
MLEPSAGTPEETKQKTAAAYNAASDTYEHEANSFWSRFGRRTVERIGLKEGARVLDVCCGSGASAIPAAETVGERGFVLGIDLAENLLNLATKKANQRALRNVEFRQGDLLQLNLEAESFDAVICVFGIFFIPDMEAAMRELWRFVMPNGKLAITTWGARFFEPASTGFWNSIQSVRPDLYKSFNPWYRISEPAALEKLFVRAEIPGCQIGAEAGTQPVRKPEDWWSMVLGTGYRGTVEQLSERDYEVVRLKNLDYIKDAEVRAVEANVLYAVAEKTKR